MSAAAWDGWEEAEGEEERAVGWIEGEKIGGEE
jgi:hypothetical protein